MTQTIIELELTGYFPKRRMKRMIDKLKDHYIVCGFGRVGRAAAAELKRAGVPFIIMDRNEAKVERAMHDDMLAALGDSTFDNNLRDVGIERAKGLVAALATDADNLFLVLSAKSLNPKLNVATRVIEEEAEQKFRRAGRRCRVHALQHGRQPPGPVDPAAPRRRVPGSWPPQKAS